MTTERLAQPPLSNPRSDRVRAVARLAGRSARQRAGRFVVEGPQAVREAVHEAVILDRAGRASGPGAAGKPGLLRELYATAEAADRFGEILEAAAGIGLPARAVTDDVLAAMLADAGTLSPQGLLAVCDLIPVGLADVLARRPRLLAVLSQVRDPGNAGTVIRAADAAGADAVVLTDASVDVHNPKCVRASAGSLFHLPVVTGIGLVDLVGQLHEVGLTVLAADGSGDVDLDDLSDDAEDRARDTDLGERGWLAGHQPVSLTEPVAWVFGNEAWGLPEADRSLADAVVRVPVHGRAESLNLATAATVCLYATARAQRRAKTAGPV
jgi:TrmH family RNA methyltransferase